MSIRFDRIKKAQELMHEHDLVGIMIMNHDDYRYFFGRDWAQPRAIIPAIGEPVMISFTAEEPEFRQYIDSGEIKTFSHVGKQIKDVSDTFRKIAIAQGNDPDGNKPKVGMQMWFDTPAFLVDLFRTVNPRVELVPSDPVIDALRKVKEPEEIELMKEAQRIATLGMDIIQEMLQPGILTRELAAEAMYTMMKAGAERTSTPIYINTGAFTCMAHGHLSPGPIKEGELIAVNLNPQIEVYCANLARTFVIGKPDKTQQKLYKTYLEMKEETRKNLKPGVKVKDLDAIGKDICNKYGLGENHIEGISHGIGLRFEEIPASTIIRTHRNFILEENMTLTIGHTILAVPGTGGVRFEDVYRVTPDGGDILQPYKIDFSLPA
ncbi:MAG: aminopeptidase P family protein [Anaerolineaceae bacterium]|nr:aminopeptidase P family protein [Anaerolineaceae bacterium]